MNAQVEYQPGDAVTVRGTVVQHIPGHGVNVELFSKTDQYQGWVREDLIATHTPKPPGRCTSLWFSDNSGAFYQCGRDDEHLGVHQWWMGDAPRAEWGDEQAAGWLSLTEGSGGAA